MLETDCCRPAVAPSRSTVTGWVAFLLFLLISLLLTAFARDQRSGFILMTSPIAYEHRANLLLGYSFLHGNQPYMKEDIPSVAQIGLMSGVRDALRLSEFREDWRFIRGIYGFLATLLAPVCGVSGAMLLVNWLSWALAAWVAWRLTLELSGSETAALVATLLTATGIGMTVHIGDYSPHLLSFATYYLGVWLLYRTRVYRDRRPWIVHARLAVYLAIACLVYNTGMMLIGVYFLTSIRHNRRAHVVAAALFALTARPLWQLLLGTRVGDADAVLLSQALAAWKDLYHVAPLYEARLAVQKAAEFVFFFDSPLVVIAGLLCCCLVPVDRTLRWFGVCVLVVPFLASYPFSMAATAARLSCVRDYHLGLCLPGMAARPDPESPRAVAADRGCVGHRSDPIDASLLVYGPHVELPGARQNLLSGVRQRFAVPDAPSHGNPEPHGQ